MAGSHAASKKIKHAEDTTPERNTRQCGGKRGGFVAGVAVLCVLLVLIAAAGGFMLFVDNTDRIFPHVRLEGVDVGGMTRTEAEMTMERLAPEGYAGKSVSVELPMEETLEVAAEAVGLGGSRQSAVESAYRYGRRGNMLENALTYASCLLGRGVDIQWEGRKLDEGALMALVEEVTTSLNARLKTATAELGEDEVAVIKGAGAVQADPTEICRLVKNAFAERSYEPVKYEPELNDADALDIQVLHDEVFTEPLNASYDKENDSITEGEDGIDFDVDEAKRLADETIAGDVIHIPLVRTEPSITAEMLEEALFRDLLSEKATSLSGSGSSRINNIELAAAAMDDTILLPGEEFSYNDCLGERTRDKGYEEAGAYANGQHTTAVGGGICQGSSTLYYCAIKANLEITERWDHYFAVSYLPMGMDATVSWYSPNFKFVNNRDYPIKIKSWTEDGYLYVEIWGTDVDGSYVDITSDGWEDAEFYYAQTYRNVYDADGNLISSEPEASSRYHKYEATED